jgi:hypothetical protein
MTPVVIEPRFAGPPNSGQGGYVAGLLAREVGNPAEVTLRLPPPLKRALELVVAPDDAVELRDGDAVVAQGRRIEAVDVDDVPVVRYADADAAAKRVLAEYAAIHPFPTCFGCGPEHPTGLHLLAGRMDSMPDVFAVPWTPSDDLADADGTIRTEFTWAALDCPTFGPVLGAGATAVLGRIAVDVRGPVTIGHRYVVTSWLIARDGRKFHTAGALSSDMGGALAVARATWIEVDAEQFVASAR